jgi:hypothetical protein
MSTPTFTIFPSRREMFALGDQGCKVFLPERDGFTPTIGPQLPFTRPCDKLCDTVSMLEGQTKPWSRKLRSMRPLRPRGDVIFAESTPSIAVLQNETRTIPIVFQGVSDPIGSGFVAGLPRPGGNITGFAWMERTMAGKWVELLCASSVTGACPRPWRSETRLRPLASGRGAGVLMR